MESHITAVPFELAPFSALLRVFLVFVDWQVPEKTAFWHHLLDFVITRPASEVLSGGPAPFFLPEGAGESFCRHLPIIGNTNAHFDQGNLIWRQGDKGKGQRERTKGKDKGKGQRERTKGKDKGKDKGKGQRERTKGKDKGKGQRERTKGKDKGKVKVYTDRKKIQGETLEEYFFSYICKVHHLIHE